jgi:hypothetical protein
VQQHMHVTLLLLRCFQHVQVAAVERMLTDIDDLPQQFQSAEIVYLSKNCLTHLEVRLFNTSRQPVLPAYPNLSTRTVCQCPACSRPYSICAKQVLCPSWFTVV